MIKIAPDLVEEAIKDLADVFNGTAIDGVIATNTTISRTGVSGHPLSEEAGGLSGAPLTESSTAVLKILRNHLDTGIPIIASGGIMSAADAREKLSAGAALVQIYTGWFTKDLPWSPRFPGCDRAKNFPNKGLAG